jgi:hypothetical protein
MMETSCQGIDVPPRGRNSTPLKSVHHVSEQVFRISPVYTAVVDVVAGLTARCGVHVEYDVEAFLFTPLHYTVEKLIAVAVEFRRVIGRHEQTIVEGNADRVET